MSSQFSNVADDLEWLRDEWWGMPDDLSEGDIRRGSATLHLLLHQGLLGRTWRHFGFPGGEPTVTGPDIIALCANYDLRPELSGSVIAGGGRLNGLDASFIGSFRIDNPETGVPAEANEGFAVAFTHIVRDSRNPGNPIKTIHCSSLGTPIPQKDDLVGPDVAGMIERQWKLSEYLASPGAIRAGSIISRGQVVDYFRNYAGGAHADLFGTNRKSKTDQHELIHELIGRVHADILDGLHFELLSIGQTVGQSPEVVSLIKAIRSN